MEKAKEAFQSERRALDERMHQLRLNEVKLTETQHHLDIVRYCIHIFHSAGFLFFSCFTFSQIFMELLKANKITLTYNRKPFQNNLTV